ISSFPLMTSLSHQRRGARRYGWFDAYDVSIVDVRHKMNARDFYVAISRATRKVVIWTEEGESSLTFDK
ncbi:MAG: hypothetical protein WAO25_01115, partial [Bacillota bacterium]